MRTGRTIQKQLQHYRIPVDMIIWDKLIHQLGEIAISSIYVLVGLILYTTSGWIGGIADFIYDYVFRDVEFAIFLAVMLCLDTWFGVLKHMKAGDASVGGFFWGFFVKMAAYSGGLVFAHVIIHFSETGLAEAIIRNAMNISLMIYFAKSAGKNMNRVMGWPPKWLIGEFDFYYKYGKWFKREKDEKDNKPPFHD